MSDIALAADFAIIVVTATVIGVAARRTGQPTIIAYILTGLVLGPVGLGVVTEAGLVELMAELGLGLLLFLLGLKMQFDDVREILRPIVNVAVWQTVLQTALALAVAWALGFDPTAIVVIALATVFGATPIIVKILSDKDEITSLPGKIDVGVLIVQDIYLVVVLALLGAESLDSPTEIAATLGVIAVMMASIGVFSIASSRYLLPRIFRRIADDEDVFLIVAIAWAFLFIAVAEGFDLSVEVGAFLAGISLAQLPYSTELEDRVAPITDFFILVFFASIGLRLAADDLLAYWLEAVVASVALMVGNFWIMFGLIRREGFGVETSFLGAINMVQVSEFSLVVGALAVNQGYVGTDVLGYLSLMALLTMTASTYVISYNRAIYERVRPWFERFESEEAGDVELTTYRDHAVAIGYDEITERVLPLLEAEYGEVVVIDRRPDRVERLEREDRYEAIYGDFRHGEVRKAAKLADASFVLSSSVERDVNATLLEEVDDDATVFVEAERIADARDLYDRGASYVVVSTYLNAEKLSDYLETYVTDREAFREAVARDVDRLRHEWRSIPDADRPDPVDHIESGKRETDADVDGVRGRGSADERGGDDDD